MSAVSGLNAKVEKGRSKYVALDINSIYKGKSLETTKTAVQPKHGLQSLGKVGAGRRMPPPANLPSLKSENSGNNPNVSLVPSGGQGWGSSPKTATTADKPELPAVTEVSSSQQPSPPLQPASSLSQPVQKTNTPSTVPSSGANKTWSSVTSSHEDGGPERNFLGQQSPFFPQEFPKLAGGDVPTEGTQKSSADTQYGPGPSLRPQTEGSWGRGTLHQPAGSGGGPPQSGGNGVNGPAAGPPPETQRPPFQPPLGPIPPQFRGMMPSFMFGRNSYPAGYPPPNYTNAPPPPPQQNTRPQYPYAENRRVQAVRPLAEEEAYQRPAAIITEKALKGFDEILQNDTQDTWATSHGEIDYNAKLVFSDDEESPANVNKKDKREMPEEKPQQKIHNKTEKERDRKLERERSTSDRDSRPLRDNEWGRLEKKSDPDSDWAFERGDNFERERDDRWKSWTPGPQCRSPGGLDMQQRQWQHAPPQRPPFDYRGPPPHSRMAGPPVMQGYNYSRHYKKNVPPRFQKQAAEYMRQQQGQQTPLNSSGPHFMRSQTSPGPPPMPPYESAGWTQHSPYLGPMPNMQQNMSKGMPRPRSNSQGSASDSYDSDSCAPEPPPAYEREIKENFCRDRRQPQAPAYDSWHAPSIESRGSRDSMKEDKHAVDRNEVPAPQPERERDRERKNLHLREDKKDKPPTLDWGETPYPSEPKSREWHHPPPITPKQFESMVPPKKNMTPLRRSDASMASMSERKVPPIDRQKEKDRSKDEKKEKVVEDTSGSDVDENKLGHLRQKDEDSEVSIDEASASTTESAQAEKYQGSEVGQEEDKNFVGAIKEVISKNETYKKEKKDNLKMDIKPYDKYAKDERAFAPRGEPSRRGRGGGSNTLSFRNSRGGSRHGPSSYGPPPSRAGFGGNKPDKIEEQKIVEEKFSDENQEDFKNNNAPVENSVYPNNNKDSSNKSRSGDRSQQRRTGRYDHQLAPRFQNKQNRKFEKFEQTNRGRGRGGGRNTGFPGSGGQMNKMGQGVKENLSDVANEEWETASESSDVGERRERLDEMDDVRKKEMRDKASIGFRKSFSSQRPMNPDGSQGRRMNNESRRGGGSFSGDRTRQTFPRDNRPRDSGGRGRPTNNGDRRMINNNSNGNAPESVQGRSINDSRRSGGTSFPGERNRQTFSRDTRPRESGGRGRPANMGDRRIMNNNNGSNSRPSSSAGHTGNMGRNNGRGGNPSAKPGPFLPKNEATAAVYRCEEIKLQDPSSVQAALTDLTNRKAKAEVGIPKIPKCDKEKPDVLDGYDLNNYASVVVIDDHPEVKEEVSLLCGTDDGFQEVTSKKKHKVANETEGKKIRKEPHVRNKSGSRSRQNKLPPRFARQRESGAKSANNAWDINIDLPPNSNPVLKETSAPPAINAWEKPINHALRSTSPVAPTVSVASTTASTVACEVQALATTSKSSSFDRSDQHDSGIDVSDQPASGTSSQRSSPSNDCKILAPPGKEVTDMEMTVPNCETLQAVGSSLNKSKESTPDNVDEKSRCMQVSYSAKNEESNNMKLDFTFDSGLDQLTENKTSMSGKALNIGRSMDVSNGTAPGVQSPISPSADDLNLKIQSVKKVWENDPPLPTVLEHPQSVTEENACPTSYGSFATTSDPSQSVYNSSVDSNSQSRKEADVSEIAYRESPSLQQSSKGVAVEHPSVKMAMAPPTAPLSPPLMGGGLDMRTMAGLASSVQVAGIPTAIPSPPTVLFNSSQQMAQTAGMYQPLQMDNRPTNATAVAAAMVQFSHSPQGYAPLGSYGLQHPQAPPSQLSGAYGQQSLFVQPPQQSQDLYSSSQYRVQPPYGPPQSQQMSSNQVLSAQQNMAGSHLLGSQLVQTRATPGPSPAAPHLQGLHGLQPGPQTSYFSTTAQPQAANYYHQPQTATPGSPQYQNFGSQSVLQQGAPAPTFRNFGQYKAPGMLPERSATRSPTVDVTAANCNMFGVSSAPSTSLSSSGSSIAAASKLANALPTSRINAAANSAKTSQYSLQSQAQHYYPFGGQQKFGHVQPGNVRPPQVMFPNVVPRNPQQMPAGAATNLHYPQPIQRPPAAVQPAAVAPSAPTQPQMQPKIGIRPTLQPQQANILNVPGGKLTSAQQAKLRAEAVQQTHMFFAQSGKAEKHESGTDKSNQKIDDDQDQISMSESGNLSSEAKDISECSETKKEE